MINTVGYHVILFFIFGILGWVIDTFYRSILEKQYISGTTIPFFGTPYAFGGLVLFFFYKNVSFFLPAQILLAGVLMVGVEYVGGVFSEKVIGRRVWDYSKSRFNYRGHVDLVHSFYWLMLAGFFRIGIFPFL